MNQNYKRLIQETDILEHIDELRNHHLPSYQHSLRVSLYSIIITEKIGFEQEKIMLDIKTIKVLLGHESFSMTTIYTQVSIKLKKEMHTKAALLG